MQLASRTQDNRQCINPSEDAGVVPSQCVVVQANFRKCLEQNFEHDTDFESSKARPNTEMGTESK
jgi:hypothetical protein